MNLQKHSLVAILSVIVATLVSRKLIIPNETSLNYLTNIGFKTFSTASHILSLFNPNKIYKNHHCHRTKKKTGSSICNNFMPKFPTIDTTTTSIFCVDGSGCCNFTTVQSAVDAVEVSSPKRTIIWINTGVYFEKVTVPKTKANVTFQGQGFESTAIVYNDNANSSHGTFYSGSVQVFAPNFIAKNLSFMNVAPIPGPGIVGAQAVAIRIAGDEAAFWGCGFFGAQDTLHDDRGRHYFKDCFIQGSIDFVFGNGRSIYENCKLISMANPVPVGSKNINGAITAHGRASNDENSGFAFVNCFVGGTGRVWLGRAWRPFSRVIFAYTSMTSIIAPEGWNDLNDPTRDQTIFYGEYKCTGEGANTTLRTSYAQNLNDTQASSFINMSFIDGDQWLQPFVQADLHNK
ncbi:hypothetical protein MKX01_008472 [Papaver californicum]|nr:hypothetical protein MKX01_008472 [Papaver californicum]